MSSIYSIGSLQNRQKTRGGQVVGTFLVNISKKRYESLEVTCDSIDCNKNTEEGNGCDFEVGVVVRFVCFNDADFGHWIQRTECQDEGRKQWAKERESAGPFS